MTKLLDPSLCQRCRAVFWPEQEAWASWIFCPRCGAPHANAAPFHQEARRQIVGPAAPELSAWLRRFWPAPLPPDERGDFAAPQKVWSGVHEGFPFIVERISVHPSVPASARILVSAFLPAERAEVAQSAGPRIPPRAPMVVGSRHYEPPPITSGQRIEPGPVYVGFCRAGAWAYADWGLGATWVLQDRADWIARLVTRLRAEGAEPPLPLVAASASDLAHLPPEAPAGAASADAASADAASPDAAVRAHGRKLRCASCGAGFPGASVTAGGRCPFCREPLALDPEVRAEVEAYRRHVRAYQTSVGLRLDPQKLWGARREGVGLTLSCGTCGAPNPHQPGRVDEVCAFCGGAVIPTSDAMDRGVHQVARAAQAKQREHGARFDSSMREWRAFARGRGMMLLLLNGVGMTSYLVYALMAVVYVQSVAGYWGSIPCMVVPPLIFAVGAGIFARRWWLRRREWVRAKRATAEQVGGVVGQLSTFSRWLSAYWNDDFPLARFDSGPWELAIVFDVATLPMAIEVDPDPSRATSVFMGALGNTAQRRALVLVAGVLPRDAPLRMSAGPAGATRAAIERCGFVVEAHVGGLLVQATSAVLKRIREEPARLTVMGPIAFAAAQLAHQLSIEPPARGGSPGAARHP